MLWGEPLLCCTGNVCIPEWLHVKLVKTLRDGIGRKILRYDWLFDSDISFAV